MLGEELFSRRGVSGNAVIDSSDLENLDRSRYVTFKKVDNTVPVLSTELSDSFKDRQSSSSQSRVVREWCAAKDKR